MKLGWKIVLLCIMAAAVFWDLRSAKIPNGLIVIGLLLGLMYQSRAGQGAGIVLYLGGILLPILFGGGLYYFRMVGAGDLKLLCVVCGFLGPTGGMRCIAGAVFAGGMIALVKILRQRSLWQRISYFSAYLKSYLNSREWRSYMEGTGKQDRFCFSVPVFLSVLCYMGGLI